MNIQHASSVRADCIPERCELCGDKPRQSMNDTSLINTGSLSPGEFEMQRRTPNVGGYEKIEHTKAVKHMEDQT